MKRCSFILGFPGQGSQKPNLGFDLAKAFPNSAGKVFQEANNCLDNLFSKIVWTSDKESQSLMGQTIHAQPIVLTTSMAVLAALEERHGFQVSPRTTHCLIGHSLGEYSCLVASKSLSLSDALLLVRKRGECMQRACSTWGKIPSMAAVLKLSWEQAKRLEEEIPDGLVCEAANENGPEQTVLSGCEEGVKFGVARAKELFGIRRAVIVQGVSCPFHSSVMKSAAEDFAKVLEPIQLDQPTVPIVFNVDATCKSDPEEIKLALVQGMYSPVKWAACVRAAATRPCSTPTNTTVEFREIGSSMLKFGLGDLVAQSIRAEVDDVNRFTF